MAQMITAANDQTRMLVPMMRRAVGPGGRRKGAGAYTRNGVSKRCVPKRSLGTRVKILPSIFVREDDSAHATCIIEFDRVIIFRRGEPEQPPRAVDPRFGTLRH